MKKDNGVRSLHMVKSGEKTAILTIVLMMFVFSYPVALSAEIQPSAVLSAESIRAHHQALVDISTKAGGLDSGIRLNRAGEEAAQYLFNGFKRAGLDIVRMESFHPNRWWPD